MTHPATIPSMRTLALAAVLAATSIVGGCATRATSINAQWVNPQSAGQLKLQSAMVMGVTRDAAVRRLYEDRMTAMLNAAGVRAVPSYIAIPQDGPVTEARMKQAVAGSGVSHVLQTRIINTTQRVDVTPGMVAGPGWGVGAAPGWGPGWGPNPWGPGWGGFSAHQSAFWGPTVVTPPTIRTTEEVHADTRLFDARNADVLWAVTTSTTLGFDTVPQIVDQFVDVIVSRLRRDALI